MLLRQRERQKSSIRCKVEHVIAVVKNIFRYRKTRYRGLSKQTANNFTCNVRRELNLTKTL